MHSYFGNESMKNIAWRIRSAGVFLCDECFPRRSVAHELDAICFFLTHFSIRPILICNTFAKNVLQTIFSLFPKKISMEIFLELNILSCIWFASFFDFRRLDTIQCEWCFLGPRIQSMKFFENCFLFIFIHG